MIDLAFPEADLRFVKIRVPPQNELVFFDQHTTGTWGVHEIDLFGP